MTKIKHRLFVLEESPLHYKGSTIEETVDLIRKDQTKYIIRRLVCDILSTRNAARLFTYTANSSVDCDIFKHYFLQYKTKIKIAKLIARIGGL